MPRVSSHLSVKDSRFGGVPIPMVTTSVNSTDANQTYTTALVLGGMIDRSVVSARTDTLPSAAALCEASQGLMPGHALDFDLRNISGAAVAVTVAAGAGGTADAKSTLSVAQNNTRWFRLVFTNTTLGSEAYTLYSLGAGTT